MMETFSLPETHPDFRLNKMYFNNEDLASVAYSFIKEGVPYETHLGNFLLDWLNEKDFIEVNTSGSTGPPKKIRLSKQAVVNSARATGSFFDLPPKTSVLHCLPGNYIAGKMMLLRAMILGWDIKLIKPRANPLDKVYKVYDFCGLTPFQLDNSLSRLHLVKKLIVGGGHVSSNLKQLVQGMTTKVYETYGMTETITHIAARHINPKNAIEEPIPFKVLPKIKIHTDKRDCLVIEAPLIAQEAIVTNDVVELVGKSEFIWKGRYDNVINSGGIKLYPEQIEAKLETIIDMRFFLASLPDDALGEKLILLVESDFFEGAQERLEKRLEEFKLLEKYEIPKKVYFVEKFEETPNGKIHRTNTVKGRVTS